MQCPESKAGRSPALQKSRSGVHECGMRLVWILWLLRFLLPLVRKPSPPSKRESIVAYRPPPAEQRSSRNFRRSAPRSFSTPVARHVAAHPRDDPSECVWRICTGDFDNDGLTDFYVTSPLGGNRLYRNRGDFRFDDVTVSAGVLETNFWGTGATFVDINNDGWLDIYACGYRVPNRLYITRDPDRTGGCVSWRRRASLGWISTGRA